jgi:branched-subunit amino acid aminotransferase/4-amino-4-deoxychorismate lyase
MIMLDGEPVAAEDVAALATTNYGHFTSFRVEDLRVRGLHLHLERLVRDGTELFGHALPEAELRALISLVGPHLAGVTEPTMVRVSVFEPGGRARVLISTRPAPGRGGLTGMRVRTTEFTRNLPHVKHVGLFGATHERKLAERAGFDDALFVSPSGLVSEGPTWNLAAVLDGELIWPDDDCLPGTTRALLQQGLKAEGMPWSTRSLKRSDLPNLTAAYRTSAGVGVHPISEIDGVALPGDAARLELLRGAYQRVSPDPLPAT